MSKVVEFPPRCAPHATGDAICTRCRHEWVAVAPVGQTQLECPECGTHCGLFKFPFGPSVGDAMFTCDCGSSLFYIVRAKADAVAAVRCRGCGQEATGWFD